MDHRPPSPIGGEDSFGIVAGPRVLSKAVVLIYGCAFVVGRVVVAVVVVLV